MLKLPNEDKELLYELIIQKKISNDLIINLVNKAIEVRYQDKSIGFKDEISDLIKEYANDKRGEF